MKAPTSFLINLESNKENLSVNSNSLSTDNSKRKFVGGSLVSGQQQKKKTGLINGEIASSLTRTFSITLLTFFQAIIILDIQQNPYKQNGSQFLH
jgi:hypothetical protein